jgi:hypothetical protein
MQLDPRTGVIAGRPSSKAYFAGSFTVLLSCRLGLVRHRLSIVYAAGDADGALLLPADSGEDRYEIASECLRRTVSVRRQIHVAEQQVASSSQRLQLLNWQVCHQHTTTRSVCVSV